MKIGFNEGCNRFCENHSVLEDLALCEQYGFDYIDVQSECLDRELAAGKYTLEQLGDFFRSHKLKMLSYNALIFFNMKQTQAEKDAVMAQLDEIIRRCQILDCKMIVVVPSMDLTVHATVDEIKADAVAVLKEMVKKVEPHGIKLSLEFCGAPTMSINRFEYAYAIVEEGRGFSPGGRDPGPVPLQRHGLRLGRSGEGRRKENLCLASERHGEYALRRGVQQRRETPLARRARRLPGPQALCGYPEKDWLRRGRLHHRGLPARLL